MIKISALRVDIENDTDEYLLESIERILKAGRASIDRWQIAKKSLDARRKNDIHYIYNIDIWAKNEEKLLASADKRYVKVAEEKHLEILKAKRMPDKRPVVVGFGPAGMFCALLLSKAGLKPIVIERGADADSRAESVEKFFKTGTFDESSNIQFGEGGAGTFSDGKLTCGVNDFRMGYILSQFVHFGAPADIMYSSKPHIGTDILRKVVKNIRKEIISLGGDIYFNTKLCDIKKENGRLCAVIYERENKTYETECENLVLAIGHSARDTFEMLYKNGFEMIQKPFSVGVRIEHLQSMINSSQYGEYADKLGAADYKLAARLPNGRGVYTFCMCPGGFVVCASSEKDSVVTNGMSLRARDGRNANSALLCDIRPEDFSDSHPLSGMYFQRNMEKRAYIAGDGGYKAPANTVGAFLNGKCAAGFKNVEPTYKPGVSIADMREFLPDFVCSSLREAIVIFDKKIKGFAFEDAVLTGVETRSSSPVRIVRDKNLCAIGTEGVFPCGEGAGYAGGIMSASLDGIKVASSIIEKYI